MAERWCCICGVLHTQYMWCDIYNPSIGSVPWSEDWPQWTYFLHLSLSSVILIYLPWWVLSTSWCCPFMLCIVFIACVHLTWHCSFLQAAPLIPHGVYIKYVSFFALTVFNISFLITALFNTDSFVSFTVHETCSIFLRSLISKALCGKIYNPSVRMTDDRDKCRKYVHAEANARIKDG